MRKSVNKELRKYLHLYIGCEIIGRLHGEYRKGYLTGIHGEYGPEIQFFEEDGVNVFEDPEYNNFTEVTPILRRLEQITAEELACLRSEMGALRGVHRDDLQFIINVNRWSPEDLVFLLSKGFDLFGLIDEGLAVVKSST